MSAARQRLIDLGLHTEEIMLKAEEIARSIKIEYTEMDLFRSIINPSRPERPFEEWPDWFGADVQTHFARMAHNMMKNATHG